MPRVARSLRYEGEGTCCGGGRWLMTSGARLPGEAILADNDLRETRTVALKFKISPFAKRSSKPKHGYEFVRFIFAWTGHCRSPNAMTLKCRLTPELSRAA